MALSNQITMRYANHRRPRPMPHQFSGLLDHPWRRSYRDPVETLGLFGFSPGMVVLDLGCGTGLFTAEMARMVGATGTIHAVDLQQPLLDVAQQRIETAGVSAQVHFHHAAAYQLPLEPNSVDLAIVIATLPQIPDRLRALREVRRVLKPEGRLAISEELPDPAYVPPRSTRQWAEAAGFRYGGQSGGLFCYSQIFFSDKDPHIIEGESTVTAIVEEEVILSCAIK